MMRTIAIALLLVGASSLLAGEIRNDEQVVRISASSFEFKPSEVVVKKGVPVTLELASQDRQHGFKLAQFHLRVDIQPGTVQKVRFVPDKVGTFTFLCDIFCGEGHEEMSGALRVVEP
jgi:cytochrome c oxidase subunit 2